MIKVCRTLGCIQDDKGVSSYMGCIRCRHTWDLYKMIMCRHTWYDKGVSSCQDDKGVSSYMGRWGCIQDDKGVYKMI